MRKVLILTGVLFSIPVLLFLIMWLYPRPVDTTPAWVFEGDASAINYCDLPVLDGSGSMAKDIPHAYTPGCGYTRFPQPILKGCTEPLSEGADDIRGLWQTVGEGGRGNHVERIEQCGNRVVVTSSGLIHDLTSDMQWYGASDDVRPLSIGPLMFCIRTSATTKWVDKKLQFYAFKYGPHVVSRYIKDGIYQWDYPSFGNTNMERICKLPEHAKTQPDRSHAL